MAQGDGTLRLYTTIDTSGARRGFVQLERQSRDFTRDYQRDLERSFTRIGATITKMLLGIFAAFRLKEFFAESIQAASDLQSAFLGLESIVSGQGRSFAQAKEFIHEYIADGLVPLQNAITAYKNLAARGYSDEQIKKTLTALKDAAAFGRQSSLTMGEAVQSATEGLKNENSILVDNAGITKNVAKMWEDYARSIGTTANRLTQQQKIQAEVNGILEESKYQVGDAAKIADTFQGKMQQLSFAFTNLKVAVGQAITPLASIVIPVITKIVNWLTRLFNTFALVMEAIFGVKYAAEQTATAVDGAATSVQNAADAAGTLQQNTQDAGKAAKKALAPFDDLAILSQGSAAGGGGAGTAAPDLGGVGQLGLEDSVLADPQTPAILQKILDALQPTIDALKRLWVAMEPFRNFVWQGLQDFYEYALKPIGQWVLGEGLPRFIDGLSAFMSGVDWARINEALRTLWQALAPFAVQVGEGLLWLWEKVLVPLGIWATNTILPVIIEAIAKALEILTPIIGDVVVIIASFVASWGIVSGIVSGVTAAMSGISTAIGFLSSPIGIAVVAIGIIIAAILLLIKHWDEIYPALEPVVQNLKNAWENVIKPIFETFAQVATDLWDNHLKPLIDNFLDLVSILADGAGEIYTNVLAPLAEWFNDVFGDVIKSVLQSALETAGNIVGGLIDTLSGIITFLKGIIQFITGAFTGDWSKAWEGVKNIFGGIWDALIGLIRTPINAIIGLINGLISGIASGINGIIRTLNNFSFDVPDWLPGIGGRSFGFNLSTINAPRIPYLAQGAVLPPNKPFMAMVGDQKHGTNIETPLSEMVKAFNTALDQHGGGSQEIVIKFTGDLASLARILQPEIEKQNRYARV